MSDFATLQIAFFEMMTVLDMYRDSWIITVFADNDARVQGSEWVNDMSDTPPVMVMSDPLYDLYCADCGMRNEHQRAGEPPG